MENEIQSLKAEITNKTKEYEASLSQIQTQRQSEKRNFEKEKLDMEQLHQSEISKLSKELEGAKLASKQDAEKYENNKKKMEQEYKEKFEQLENAKSQEIQSVNEMLAQEKRKFEEQRDQDKRGFEAQLQTVTKQRDILSKGLEIAMTEIQVNSHNHEQKLI